MKESIRIIGIIACAICSIIFLVENTSAAPTDTTINNTITGSESTATVGNTTTGDSTSSATTGPVTILTPKQTAAASGPALTASNDACMGSRSAGAQGASFGLSFGSTWKNEDCNRRKNAVMINNLGFKDAAVALVCMNKDVKKAMELTGTPCVEPVEGSKETSKSSWRNPDIKYEYPSDKKRRH